MNTVHQLTEEEFQTLVDAVKGQSKKSLKGQLSFEKNVLNRGWDFDTNYEYKNARTKVDLICDKGHYHLITSAVFKKGHGCPKCVGLCPIQTKIDFEANVLKRAWDFGAEYGYKNATEKVSLICDNGHNHTISPDKFKRGIGCPKCAGQCPTQAKEDFEANVLNRAWDFSADYEYKNSATNVSLICDKGHHHLITPNNFKHGNGCPKCAKNGFRPNLPASLYLSSLSIDGIIKGYKLGITNNSVEARMRQHSKHSIFDHAIVEDYKFEIGKDALDLENKLKLGLYCNYFTKDQIPDGFTETIPPDQLEKFYSILTK